MLVDGTFDTLSVQAREKESEWSFESVDFNQDGFAFRCFLHTEAYPLVDNGYTVRGYINGDVTACGDIQKIVPITHDGDSHLRLFVTPPNNYINEYPQQQ